MNTKQLTRLALIFAVLILVWYGQQAWKQRQSSQYASQVKFDLPGSGGDIRRIVISHQDKKVALQQKDNIWFVETDKPFGTDFAVEDNAKRLVSVLDGIPVELVSQNPDRHPDLKITDELATKIEFYTSADPQQPPVAILLVSEDKSLIREANKQNVYRWSSQYSSLSQTESQPWIAPTPTVNLTPTAEPTSQ